ncbi:RNA-binding domain-containing protein [Dothidotthia symphoricarpi CBS 119687]|uniref:RNA-binding domain-containing protein n=1 Tax=Dothidotthia symphoricarpi CBS 119687 TaxID=1392245 RepID=A0A6A6AB24_9PLEO|nr:RNA-binding domain-containing protein [Dothidotthia symphoricarpi CBS 119687]KAF2128413.1 RNA-binding domain-containing protein [Dothidotthia symphoricarpi CBS 119687]
MSAPSARHWEQNKEATVYVGNLHERITPRLLHELMLNAGRVRNVNMPVDRVNGQHQGFGFVEFHTEAEADYAPKIMNNVALHGNRIRVNKASADKQKNVEIGAELFIGNLDGMVDEKTLYDTFGQFGPLINAPKVARDDNGLSKGYGFISFGDFESSDGAIASMHGQYMMNKQISVQYAYKKDGKGERHGDEAERMLAKQAKAHGVAPAVQPLPAHLFQLPAALPPSGPQGMMDGRGVSGAPNGPSGFGPPNGNYGPPNGNYGAPPGPAGFGRAPPPAGPPSLPVAPPASGLPARPPSGIYPPPGFGGAPNGAPGYGYPPAPGFGPPGFAPPR